MAWNKKKKPSKGDMKRERKRLAREEGRRISEAIKRRFKREAILKAKNSELDSACRDKVNDDS
jgi:hypothetical protein